MTVNEKIAALRAAAKAQGANGVLVMTSDPHCSEYLPDYYNALPWFTGFTGENATLVVTETESALWVDGRFYVQADKQLAGTEIQSMHDGAAGVPKVAEWLTSHFTAGQTLLLDGSCVPTATVNNYVKALEKSGASLRSLDVTSAIWGEERPALPDTPCFLLNKETTGADASEKIAAVRAELAKEGANALAVTGLDCVAWLLNIRAHDLTASLNTDQVGRIVERCERHAVLDRLENLLGDDHAVGEELAAVYHAVADRVDLAHRGDHALVGIEQNVDDRLDRFLMGRHRDFELELFIRLVAGVRQDAIDADALAQALGHYLARLGVEQLVLQRRAASVDNQNFHLQNSLMPYLAACFKPRKPI